MPMVLYYIMFRGCVAQNPDGSKLVGVFHSLETNENLSGILYRNITEWLW